MTLILITALLLCAGIWSVLCRLAQMQHGVTQPLIVVQHLVLGLGLAGGLLLPMQISKLALALGVVAYLLGSTGRWRHGAPAGTANAMGDLHGQSWPPLSSEDQA